MYKNQKRLPGFKSSGFVGAVALLPRLISALSPLQSYSRSFSAWIISGRSQSSIAPVSRRSLRRGEFTSVAVHWVQLVDSRGPFSSALKALLLEGTILRSIHLTKV